MSVQTEYDGALQVAGQRTVRAQNAVHRVRVLDSHTGGEPTRLVTSGGPDLGSGPIAERLHRLRTEHDDFRSAVVNEPRGSDVVVGALLDFLKREPRYRYNVVSRADSYRMLYWFIGLTGCCWVLVFLMQYNLLMREIGWPLFASSKCAALPAPTRRETKI